MMNIIGRLTGNAEVNTLPSEKQVVNFSVAVNDSYRNKQGERVQQTAYFNCAYWLTTKVAQHLTKGTLVELTGRVGARAWIGKNGQPKASLDFQTSQIRFHGGGSNNNESPQEPANTANNKASKTKRDDDLPF